MIKQRFVIAGERRSGSTSLYEILKKHPEVHMIAQSDFDFFIEPELFDFKEKQDLMDWDTNHSKDDYEQVFQLNNSNAYKDADLLWWRKAHDRIAEYDKQSKFIFILREPIKRAESHYMNELKKGREKMTFNEAIKRNEIELSDWERLHLCYKERGHYAKSLKRFYRFVDKSRVKVIVLEELFDHWETQMEDLCKFLEIDYDKARGLHKVHSNKELVYIRRKFANAGLIKSIVNFYERATEAVIVRISNQKDTRRRLRRNLRFFYQTSFRKQFKMGDVVKQELQAYYKPLNKELEDLLGREIKYWKYD